MCHLLDVQRMSPLYFSLLLGIHWTAMPLQLLTLLLKGLDYALGVTNSLIVDPLKLCPVGTD